MRDALILVVIMALAAAAVWCQPPSGYICGKVYWRIGNDTGAAYVDVYCKPVAGGPTTHTETNCCGLDALENLLNNTWYDVWAVHMKNVSWPCPHAGSLCDTTIYTETLVYLQAQTV